MSTRSRAGAGAGAGQRPGWRWRQRDSDRRVEPGPAVIFDLDGVLSDARGRQHYLAGLRRDWDAFFEACGEDPLVPEVARLLELIDQQLVVILLTARPARVRKQTVEWLERYGVRYDLLVMRDHGDYLSADRFKQAEARALRSYGFDIRLAVEDDPRNLVMFEREGIPCLYVHSGYYG